VAVLALLGALLSQASAWATYGIGIHAGMDYFTINAQETIAFTLIDSSTVALSRDEISNPYHFGVHFFFDDIPAPFIDELDISVDFSSKKYSYHFENYNYTGGGSQLQPPQVKYSRIGGAVTIRHYVMVLPSELETFRLYAGIGLGMQLISPIVSRNLIYDNLFDSVNPLNLEDQGILKKSSKAAFVGLVGIRIQPPEFPVSLRAEGRYYGMGEWNYQQPRSLLQVLIGLSYSM